ncbi:MAG: glycosyltransferase family 4 protein [Armatimonadota bacterium]|nr:glycosyltransferase family 4 protein [bacterium]
MSKSRKILFLAHLFPLPLDSGGKIKSFHTLKILSSMHDVAVLAYVRNQDEMQRLDELRHVCSSVTIVSLVRGKFRNVADLTSSLISRKSFIVSRDYRREMQEAFTRLVGDFQPDVVHIDHLQMAQFVDFNASYRTVLDNHNVECMIIKRIAESSKSTMERMCASIEWPKLRAYELDACRRCDAVLTVSEEDKATLQEFNQSLANIHTVPIGVDTDYFASVERVNNSKNIISIGTMYWPPNIDSMLYFYREILPLVKREVPDCTLTIIGQRPAAAIKKLESDPAVKVTGTVDDVREPARDCGAFVVPLRSGSGVRVKILNAFAMGLPVVSTTVGVEGITAKHGEHLMIADSPADFSRCVAQVLKDPWLAEKLGNNGRKLVAESYSWQKVGERLLNVYELMADK